MALSDYKLCDKCGSKAFYDANLRYDFAEKINGEWVQPADPLKEVGVLQPGVALGYLGDWAVLCNTCSKTHRTAIEEISDVDLL